MSKAGRKPFGYYDDEMAVIELLFLKANRRPHGKKPTYQAIADSLNKDGHKTQKGIAWYPIAVRRVIVKGIEYYRTLHDKLEPVREPEVVKKPQKKKAKPVTALTQEEIDICREALIESDRVLFEVLLGAGLRASECCSLQINDINIEHGNSYIEVKLGKGAKPRNVKIDSFLSAILKEYRFR